MKKVIRCKKCGKRAEVRNCGFVKNVKHICSRTDSEVSLDDGCTFGVEGKPMVGIDPIEVHISNHAIVWGNDK